MEIKNISSFIDYYERVRERTNKVIAVIPIDKMDWTYKEGKFTIADIIRHIAAIERNMYAENVKGNSSKYNGCGKELADGYNNVISYFNKMHTESVAIFNQLNDADLHKKCKTPGGIDITIWKWLRAMIEHEIHHRAQLYIYLNLLDIKTPPIFGLSAEEVQAKYTEK